jgi:hypothetical protein
MSKPTILLAAVLGLACSSAPEPARATSRPASQTCPTCPPQTTKTVYVIDPDCHYVRRELKFRNARIEERVDQCEAAGNSFVQCSRWVFGYIEDAS